MDLDWAELGNEGRFDVYCHVLSIISWQERSML